MYSTDTVTPLQLEIPASLGLEDNIPATCHLPADGMSGITLTYFNLRGRGEPARLLLALSGKEFTDKRFPTPWEDR